MSGLCKDCKYWERVSEDDRTAFMLAPAGWGHCLLTNYYEVKPHGTLAVAEEYSSLATAPEFGCVQFQPEVSAQEREVFGEENG